MMSGKIDNKDWEFHDKTEKRPSALFSVVRRTIDDFKFANILSALKNNDDIGDCDFQFSNFNHEHSVLLARALTENQSVRKLDLSNTLMNDIGLLALINLLEKYNQTVTEINLAGCRIKDEKLIKRLNYLLEVNAKCSKFLPSVKKSRETLPASFSNDLMPGVSMRPN